MTRAAKARAVVTGATGAIGGAIARGLATAGFEVVITARDAGRGAEALARIQRAAPGALVRWEEVDLSRQRSVAAFAERFEGPLDVLVNNAAETPRRRQETPEGLERQFATNIMGYFWMIEALRPALASADTPRVVNVASYWAGGLDLDDLQFRRRRYDNDAAYRQSKQADRMLTVAFARRLEGEGVAINACHPGDVPSKLASDLGFGGHQSAEEGAATPLWLATEEVGVKKSGCYFERRQEVRCSFGADEQACETLFARCAEFA